MLIKIFDIKWSPKKQFEGFANMAHETVKPLENNNKRVLESIWNALSRRESIIWQFSVSGDTMVWENWKFLSLTIVIEANLLLQQSDLYGVIQKTTIYSKLNWESLKDVQRQETTRERFRHTMTIFIFEVFFTTCHFCVFIFLFFFSPDIITKISSWVIHTGC